MTTQGPPQIHVAPLPEPEPPPNTNNGYTRSGPASNPTPAPIKLTPPLPKSSCLRDIMNDEYYTKYSEYSDIDVTKKASLSNSASPQFAYNYAPHQPNHKPPPLTPTIHVVNVHPHEYSYDESLGTTFIADAPSTASSIMPDPNRKDVSYFLWDTHMFPIEELENSRISPSTILKLLATEDATRFTTPLDKKFAQLNHFRLQIDGAADCSVTNKKDCLHTYWDMIPYKISGIGDSIICTGKGIFHFICDNRSVIPITIFFHFTYRCRLFQCTIFQ